MTDSDEAFRPMSKGFLKDYMDLLAYQTSFQLSKEIFETTKQFHMEEIRLLEIGRLLNGMIERSSAFLIRDDRVREDPSINEFI